MQWKIVPGIRSAIEYQNLVELPGERWEEVTPCSRIPLTSWR